MKSSRGEEPVTFAALQLALLALLRTRINNGHFTERGLARILGISQPQLHNVIKGKRRLQTDLADRILEEFGIGVQDLISALDLYRQSSGSQNLSVFYSDPMPYITPLPNFPGRRGSKKGSNPEKYHRRRAKELHIN